MTATNRDYITWVIIGIFAAVLAVVFYPSEVSFIGTLVAFLFIASAGAAWLTDYIWNKIIQAI